MGKLVGFAVIAAEARGHNIVPSGPPPFVPRHHMIKIEVFIWKFFTAILASVVVTQKHVMSGKLHFLSGQFIIHR